MNCVSEYKFFGPHAGALDGKYDLLDELKAYKVRPASDELPYNYALAIVERMGLLELGGMIRVGAVHYNTIEERERFGEVLKQVA